MSTTNSIRNGRRQDKLLFCGEPTGSRGDVGIAPYDIGVHVIFVGVDAHIDPCDIGVHVIFVGVDAHIDPCEKQ